MTSAHVLLILFFGICGAGVIVASVLSDRRNPAALAWFGALASVVLLWASGQTLITGDAFHANLWRVPGLGTLSLAMDRISALFVCITALIYLFVSVFSAGYMGKYAGRYSLRSFGVFYHLLFGAIVLTLIAGDVFSFLVAWEAMSIFCYLLVIYEHENEESTSAGLLMLCMGEAGTLAVAVALLLLARASGALGFDALRGASGHLGAATRGAVFLLAFFGFGVKAGLVPTSSWLPRAHPVAPGNVSALLSSVILNLGIYGIVRVDADLLGTSAAGLGLVVLVVGSLTAIIGILYATTEDDMKKMLAHSSIENMGIIVAGLGAGFVFMAYHRPALAGIAFVTALYHTVNHSLYKALLFLGAGAVDAQSGTRDMNRLGGLIKVMPWTSAAFLVGSLSIAALPPFNGFVSEWLTLQTMLRSSALPHVGTKVLFALCGACLALTAALAVTCFVKAFAMSFLGPARTRPAAEAIEPPRVMRAPMIALALLCFGFGVIPTYVIPLLARVVSPFVGQDVADELVPPFFTVGRGNPKFGDAFVSEFHDLGAQVGRGILPGRGLVVLHRGTKRNPVVFAMSTSYMAVVLALLVGGTYLVVGLLTRRRQTTRGPVWAGGIRRLFPDMTYTATGFSNPVRVIFDAVFRPSRVEDTRETVAEHFRTAIRNGRQESYIIDRAVVEPVARCIRWLADVLSRAHSGRVNAYTAYVLVTLLVLLAVTSF